MRRRLTIPAVDCRAVLREAKFTSHRLKAVTVVSFKPGHSARPRPAGIDMKVPLLRLAVVAQADRASFLLMPSNDATPSRRFQCRLKNRHLPENGSISDQLFSRDRIPPPPFGRTVQACRWRLTAAAPSIITSGPAAVGGDCCRYLAGLTSHLAAVSEASTRWVQGFPCGHPVSLFFRRLRFSICAHCVQASVGRQSLANGRLIQAHRHLHGEASRLASAHSLFARFKQTRSYCR